MKTTRKPMMKVEKKKVANHMTCHICDGLYRDATTIQECLHSFCKECIVSKIREKGIRHCPVCSVYLGTTPLDKLRPDHSIQNIRGKLFPPDEEKAKTPAADVPPVPSEPKRKEKSPVALGACTPNLPRSPCQFSRKAKEPSTSRQTLVPPKEVTPAAADAQPDAVTSDNQKGEVENLNSCPAYHCGRKRKSARRKNPFPRRFTPTIESGKAAEENKEEGKFLEIETTNETSEPGVKETTEAAGENKTYEKFSELKTPNETSEAIVVQHPSIPDLNELSAPEKTSENNADFLQDKDYNSGSFSCLVDVANNAKANNSAMHDNFVQPAPIIPSDNEVYVPLAEGNKHSQKLKALADDDHQWTPRKSTSSTRRLRGTQQSKARNTKDFNLNVSAKAVINLNSESKERSNPVWFSLVPSEAKEVNAQLPELSSRFLRVRDSTVPVSSIQKYVMKKLGLTSDNELEISLQGRPLSSSLQLNNLVEMWEQTGSTQEKITTSVGSSGSDFVMVLNYSRKCYP